MGSSKTGTVRLAFLLFCISVIIYFLTVLVSPLMVTDPNKDRFVPILTKTEYPVTLTLPYRIRNPGICAEKVDILVIVHSSTVNFGNRKILRQTWANKNMFRFLRLRVAFLLGLPPNGMIQAAIDEENSQYRDIVQGTFIDTYRNLTNKGVMGLRWILDNCRHAGLVIKSDDDVVVDIFMVLERYLPRRTQVRTITCNLLMKNLVRREGVWAVDPDEFKGVDRYPPHCSGFLVFITTDMILPMFQAAHFTPFFWIDDVYLFHLLPSKIFGTTMEAIPAMLAFYPDKVCLQYIQIVGREIIREDIACHPANVGIIMIWDVWRTIVANLSDANRELIYPEELYRSYDTKKDDK